VSLEYKLPPDPRIGTVVSGRYRIDALIGEGGMGKVYAVEHVAMHKRLALKVLHRELSVVPEIVTRFEREAMAAANVDHANIATATDFGKLEDDSVFIALELVEGRCLRDVIAAGPIPVRRALGIARQIAAALGAAHALSIVHRDLKPENVMLVERNGDPDFVKVLDFGVAKVPIGEGGATGPGVLTRIGTVFGTPEYIPPEQALGQPSDGRADLYSLGVILYEMLTGVRPFTSTSQVNLVGMHLGEPPPRLEDRAPGLGFSDELEALVARLLKKPAAERPQHAEDVIKEIDAILERPLRKSPRHAGGALSARFADLRALVRPRLAKLEPLRLEALAAFERGVAGIERLRANLPPGLVKPLERVGSATLAKVVLGLTCAVFVLAIVGIAGTLGRSHERAAGVRAETPLPSATQSASAASEPSAAASAAPAPSPPPVELGLEPLLERVKARSDAKDDPGVLDAVKAALEEDPIAKNDARVATALFQAAQDKTTSDAAFELLEGPMRDKGASIVHDLAVFAPKGSAAQRRAEAWLGSPAFDAVASPALALAVSMRRARSCKQVRALLPDVKAKGDKQSLPYLKFFKDHLGSYPCLKQDKLLAETTEAVSARSK
jgi:serine/threonine-protein kinase